MSDDREGLGGCIVDILAMIGFVLALAWPILLLFLDK
jgi:hypothetical protein